MIYRIRKLTISVLMIIIVFLISGCSEGITGSGTREDPYIINNFSGMKKVGTKKYSLDAYYQLGSDIDATITGNEDYNEGKGWKPIGEYNNEKEEFKPFTGVFDGKNHEIKGLKIQRSKEEVVGLFSYIKNGDIKNLGLVDLDICGKRYVGGIAGYNRGLIENSYTEGKIRGEWMTGGITGWNFTGTIRESYSRSDIDGIGWLGGLVGLNSSALIEKSYTTGGVKGKDWNAGGLVGANRENGIISTCYARGEVQSYSRVGGLTGINTGIIKESYSTGRVKGEWLTGGLIGWNFQGIVQRSYWDQTSSGLDISDGGTGRSSVEMKNSDTYRNWDFEEVWEIEEEEYPEHQ